MRIGVELLVVAVFVIPVSVSAGTIRVPSDYSLISAAVQAAVDGDTVLVSPGTYIEHNIDFGGKEIVVESVAGATETIVDAESSERISRGFVLDSGETTETVLDGFTVIHGYAFDGAGAGLCVVDASPAILNCRFVSCCAESWMHGGAGGGAIFDNSRSTVQGCTFIGNSADGCGGAMLVSGESRLTVEDCEFIGNAGGFYGGSAMYIDDDSRASVLGCAFVSNSGRVVLVDQIAGVATLDHCTFADNFGPVVSAQQPSQVMVLNCILARNVGSALVACSGAWPGFAYCCVFGNESDVLCGTFAEGTLLREDPLWCDWASGDCTLCSDSPCLPEGNSWGRLIGAYGAGCGACATAVEPRSWGAIKAMYR